MVALDSDSQLFSQTAYQFWDSLWVRAITAPSWTLCVTQYMCWLAALPITGMYAGSFLTVSASV
jgi:hypothetical protein